MSSSIASLYADFEPEILVASDGPVRIVTLNRPEDLNAVNHRLHAAFAAIWRRLANDPDAKAVVLTGAGRAFCAGGDLDWFAEIATDATLRASVIAEAREIVLEMSRFPLPVVAAINGPAMGLGCSISILCDLVYMADHAFLADPHVAVGIVAGDGGAAAWPLLTSLLRAKEYVFTGDRIPAAEAERFGLVNHVVPLESLMPDALAMAHRLAGLPTFALRATKRAFNIHLDRAICGVLDHALAAESESFLTDEHRERMLALRK